MVSFDGVGVGSRVEGFLDAFQVVVSDRGKEPLVLFGSFIRIGTLRHESTSLPGICFVGIPQELLLVGEYPGAVLILRQDYR